MSPQDAELLQKDLNKIIGWAKENMTFKFEKFKVLRQGKNNAIQSNHHETEMELTEEAVIMESWGMDEQ